MFVDGLALELHGRGGVDVQGGLPRRSCRLAFLDAQHAVQAVVWFGDLS